MNFYSITINKEKNIVNMFTKLLLWAQTFCSLYIYIIYAAIFCDVICIISYRLKAPFEDTLENIELSSVSSIDSKRKV